MLSLSPSFFSDKSVAKSVAILSHIDTLGKRPWARVKLAPEFWNARDRRGLRCISGRDNFGKYLDPEPIYASESFSWEMWSHAMPSKAAALPRMQQYVERTFPGYAKACGARFPIQDVMRDCFDNADVAFLTAAWLYSSVLSNDVFPCGLRQWPPPKAS